MPQQIVHVPCTLVGHEECWIKYDVTEWGISEFIDVPYRSFQWVLREFIPAHSVDWHIVNDAGEAIVHPGQGASEDVWREVWDAFGARTGRALYRWLGLSAMAAIGEAMDLPFKSAGNGAGRSAGDENAGGRDAGDATA